MRLQKITCLALLGLITSCGGAKDPEEYSFSCPQIEEPEICTVEIEPSIELADLVGRYTSDGFIRTPDGRYVGYRYQFFSDSTYEVQAEAYLPIAANCQGYSDGGWQHSESGTFSVESGILRLEPSSETVNGETHSEASAYMLNVNSLDTDSSVLTLSGPEFCGLKLNKWVDPK
jgi:hypothetical protein